MRITKIELEDVKSHIDSKFEFSHGTTAITGENGAGKTTLIEAVAWTLFDLLDYKKDDFVRRGAKKGVVRVTFESGLDEREYTVYRDTGTGYYVYDPRLRSRIAEKKEEVTRFLWQHLGVEAGTDLETLFRRAIGVPQGTFTAIFLESATERKKAFDKLLKVEEYRQGAEKLRETVRHVENSIAAVRERIARSEGQLQQYDRLREEHEGFAKQAAELEQKLFKITAEIENLAAKAGEMDAAEKRLRELQAAFDRIAADKERNEILVRQKLNEVEQATQAASVVEAARAGYESHSAAVARLAELDRERGERDKLRRELSDTEAAVVQINSDRKRINDSLENALKAHRAIEALQPKAAEQNELESAVIDLRDKFAAAKAAAGQVGSLAEKVQRLRESYASNQAQIRETESKASSNGSIEELQARQSDVVKKLASLQAALERDEKFQKEIQNGLCPILSQKCLNLKEGETLESFVSSQFTEVRSEITGLEAEQQTITLSLRASMEAAKYTQALVTLRSRAEEIREEGERLKAEMAALQQPADGLAAAEAELATAETKLNALDNPKAKIRLFETEAAREAEFRQQLSNVDANLERLESERQIKVEQLEIYMDLDRRWAETTAARDAAAEDHRKFVANEETAKTLEPRRSELEELNRILAEISANLEKADTELKAAAGGYDRDEHAKLKAELNESEKRQVETRTTLAGVKQRQEQLAAELERLAEIRKAMAGEYLEKEKLEKVAELTAFIRDTLKDAAPRVARNYVYHVSLEANQLFREICGDAKKSLKWTDDYGIAIEEQGHERPFSNLSGGEQMAAALSVRLALLKQLSDIRIAFFDEPTTNMDAERRENLAQQISQIKHFDQLFVISHDDTFEGYVDNVVTVERDGGKTE